MMAGGRRLHEWRRGRRRAVLAGILLAVGSFPVAGQPADGRAAAPAAPAKAAAADSHAAARRGPVWPASLPPAVAAARQEESGEAFGFTLGEERRYVLEPERALRAGESAWWAITLEDISGSGDDRHVTFALQHQHTEVIRDMFGGPSGRMQVVDVEAQVTMNRFGFPERVVINEQSDLSGETGSQSDVRTTVYVIEGDRYVKRVRLDGRDWEFKIRIRNDEGLDLDTPRGLYAFLPSALSCLGLPGVPGRPASCAEGEVAFANPGLLSVVLKEMWQEHVNEKEFLFFEPFGIGTAPSALIDINRLMRSERDQLRNTTRYFEKTKLEFKEYVEDIEVGPRTASGWKVDAGGNMREFYTDGNGMVLKVELDPHPVTHGSRWIRLLYPSEY